ncbi:MAG: hypothetical protein AAGJ86_04525 [Pseudomonadota bacterium]
MSYNWCFHSYDDDAFEKALIHDRQRIVDAVLNEIGKSGGYPAKEIQQYERIAGHITARGFDYQGLAKADLPIMDRFVFDAFHTLGADISFTPESHEFLSPYVTTDLPSHLHKKHFFSKPKPIPAAEREYLYLPIFTHFGRRLDEEDPSECEYVALSVTEVASIEQELVKFLATPDGQALDEANDNNLSNDFLKPVQSALKKGKALHAQVS